MKLKNTTNITNERIKEILNFVKPQGKLKTLRWLTVRNILKDERGPLSGHAYANSIEVWVTNNENAFPRKIDYSWKVSWEKDDDGKTVVKEKDEKRRGKLGYYLPQLLLSREEALVSVIAHEYRHIWQRNHNLKKDRVWGSKGKSSERDCDAYAIKMTRAWRRKERERRQREWLQI